MTYALHLDAIDPLALWRDEFVIPDNSLIYLDGNSLEGCRAARSIVWSGRCARVGGRVDRFVDHWLDLPQRAGDRLAPLIGAGRGEVVVHDSTTINLYQLIDAACARRPDRGGIAISSGEFQPIATSWTEWHVLVDCVFGDDFENLDDVAVTVRSVVDYRSAALGDVAGETTRATAAGALASWDLSHAAGVLEVDLGAAGVQLAVGCTYKYLNGGPGLTGVELRGPVDAGHVAAADLGLVRAIRAVRHGPDLCACGPHSRRASRTPSGSPSLLLKRGSPSRSRPESPPLPRRHARPGSPWSWAISSRWSRRRRDPARRGGHVAVHHLDARNGW